MSFCTNRFMPSLESLDARINMSALVAAPAPDASNQGWGTWEVKAADADTSDGINKLGSQLLSIQGDGTYAGAPESPVGASESITVGGPQVKDPTGNVYTITFGGSL